MRFGSSYKDLKSQEVFLLGGKFRERNPGRRELNKDVRRDLHGETVDNQRAARVVRVVSGDGIFQKSIDGQK